MTKSRIKILEGLSGLSQRELRRFRHFTASPYFGSSTRLPDLLDTILKCKGDDGDQKKWHRRIRNRFAGNNTQLNRNFSALFTLLCQFLAWERLNADPGLMDDILSTEFRQRGYRKSLQHIKRKGPKVKTPVVMPFFSDPFSLDSAVRPVGDPLTLPAGTPRVLEQARSRLDRFYRVQQSRLAFYSRLNGENAVPPAPKPALPAGEVAYRILTEMVDRGGQCPPLLEWPLLRSLSQDMPAPKAREVSLTALQLCGDACLNGRESLANEVLKAYNALHRQGLLADPADGSIPVVQLH